MVHPGYERCIAYGTPWYMPGIYLLGRYPSWYMPGIHHLGMYTSVPPWVHPYIPYPTLVYPVMMYTTLGVREGGPWAQGRD